MPKPLDLPELATPAGFTLRPWRLDDLDLVREASRDPYIPLVTTVPRVWSEAEGVAFVERQWAKAAAGQGYSLVVVDPDGRPAGYVGLWLREVAFGRASLGYWVLGSARGRGAASQSLVALVDWARRALGIPRLELHVEPWNDASLRTAERAGFHREGVLRDWLEIGGERRDMVMFSLLASDPWPESPRVD